MDKRSYPGQGQKGPQPVHKEEKHDCPPQGFIAPSSKQGEKHPGNSER